MAMPSSFDAHGLDQSIIDNLLHTMPGDSSSQQQKMREFSMGDLNFDGHILANHQPSSATGVNFVPCVPELDLQHNPLTATATSNSAHPLRSPGAMEVPGTPTSSPRGSIDNQNMFANMTSIRDFETLPLSRHTPSSPSAANTPTSPTPAFPLSHAVFPVGLSAATKPRPQTRKVRLEGSIRRRYETLMKEGPPCDRKPANGGKKSAVRSKKRKGCAEDQAKRGRGADESEEEKNAAAAGSGEEGEAERLEKNRQSARDCRLRKKYYIKGLESKVEEYQEREEQHLAALEEAQRQINEWQARHEALLQQCRHYGLIHV